MVQLLLGCLLFRSCGERLHLTGFRLRRYIQFHPSDGKLYLEAICFAGADKSTINVSVYDTPISTVDSGFYALDLASGKLEKIYPYIHGEVYFAPNGALYISADYAREKRLINLKAGKVILFE